MKENRHERRGAGNGRQGRIGEDDRENLGKYVKEDGGYDDATMRQALENVRKCPHQFDLIQCNCQDFADEPSLPTNVRHRPPGSLM